MKKLLIAVFVAIVVLGVIVATMVVLDLPGDSLEPRDHISLRISTFLTAIDYGPFMIAKRNGWIEEELGRVDAVPIYLPPFQSPAPINEAFATGRVDAVFTAEVPTIIGRAAGVPVAISWLSATLNSEIVVREGSEINALPDLVGSRIATLAGSSPHYGLVQHLQSEDISLDNVSVVDMPVPEARTAFDSGQVDAWAIWPPFVEMQVHAGKGRILPGHTAPVQVVLELREEIRAASPEIEEAFIRALERGRAWIIQNPEEAQRIIAEDLDFPLPVVEMAWSKIEWNANLNSEIVDDIQRKADFLFEHGFIKNRVDVRQSLISERM